jgi:hypothetical protein
MFTPHLSPCDYCGHPWEQTNGGRCPQCNGIPKSRVAAAQIITLLVVGIPIGLIVLATLSAALS